MAAGGGGGGEVLKKLTEIFTKKKKVPSRHKYCHPASTLETNFVVARVHSAVL